MKTRPILFSAPMVRAILEGRKTQTRQIIKPTPLKYLRMGLPFDGKRYSVCRLGQPGDRLWVRETFTEFVGHHAETGRWAYRADMKDSLGEQIRQDYIKAGYPYQWKPSIHLPRWASRITLEITGVRVERLNEISEADAMAEGIESGDCLGIPGWKSYNSGFYICTMPSTSFRTLWESINGPGSWDANPWVWVVAFKRDSTHN